MKKRSFGFDATLFFYLAVTLGVPVANGGYHRPGFVTHAVTVLFGAISVTALRSLFRRSRLTFEDM
jgi:hypothetical protein